MGNKAKKKLTDIRPREVSFVDNPANEKQFLVVKNAEKKDGEGDQPIVKKIEVAVHLIRFSKGKFKTGADCIKFLTKQGIEGADKMPIEENDWEFMVTLNDELLFEGSSLGMYSSVVFGLGADGVVGVLKSMDIEKVGAKISASRLKKIKEAFGILDSLIKENESKEEKSMDENVKKNEDQEEKTPDAKPEAAPEAAPEDKKPETDGKTEPEKAPEGEVKPEDKDGDKEPEGEKKPEGDKPAEESEGSEEPIEKRIEALEKSMKGKLAEKDKTIEKLEKRVKELENEPADSQGAPVDNTENVEKNEEKGMWDGVL